MKELSKEEREKRVQKDKLETERMEEERLQRAQKIKLERE